MIKKGHDRNLECLRRTFEPEKPLAKLIPTDVGYFLYDTGTNKILGCKDEVAVLLHALFTNEVSEAQAMFVSRYGEKVFHETAAEITAAVDNENILKVRKAVQFGLSDHFGNIEEILNTTVQSVCLELTQSCNCRCMYCPYSDFYKGKRNHGEKVMSLETAKKAIDFLKDHSSKSESVAVGFYGGEPLLQFDLLKKCVTYAKELIDIKKLSFNLTTNATLMTPEIAEYLLDNDFSILASIDGPKEVNDRFRIDKNGNGSFEMTMNGLRILAEKRQKIKKGQISINAVYTPPYSEEKLNAVGNFFKELKWLPEINVTTVYPSEGTIPANLVPENGLNEDKGMAQWATEKYGVDFDKSEAMVKGIIGKQFARLMKREVYTEPLDDYSLNGCCVPGQRKSFIDVDGNIFICEKITDNAPRIGHVAVGFDLDTIKKIYIDDYAEKSLVDCAGCWGLRLCDICYYSAYNAIGEPDMEKKRKFCDYNLQSMLEVMRHFISLLAKNPGRLDFLYQHEIE
jgi:uncharacterized protein